MKRRIGLLISGIVIFLAGMVLGVAAQEGGQRDKVQAAETVNGIGTAFTYQGMLTDNGAPADGIYDLQFALFDAASGGNQIGSTVTVDNESVSDGLLAVTLDFGENVFTGSQRYLEIRVRAGNSTGSYDTLDGRQPLTASPYAVYSGTAHAVAAEMHPPAVITATATSGGFLTAGTYYFKIVTSDGVGTSMGSDELSCTVDGSSTNRCALAWDAVPGAASYRVYKGATSNGQNLYQTTSTNSYNYDTDSGSTAGTVPTTPTAFINNINPSGDSWLLSGNLGMGTTDPVRELSITGHNAEVGIRFNNQGSGNNSWGIVTTNDSSSFGGSKLIINDDSVNQPTMTFWYGRVGIATTSPATKLDVAGDVRIQGNLEVTGASTTGPHFITPVTVSSGTGGPGTVPWTTFDASAYIPVNATAVILEAEAAQGGDLDTRLWIRADSLSSSYILLRGQEYASSYTSWAGQGLFPISNRMFQFTIEGQGFDADYAIRLIGYFN